jgi:alkylation response protein AidB-like acyl-CoA dehydrogenase
VFGTAAPDTGNMEMLAAHGTEEQKQRWLYPLLNQELFSAYSMTEPQGGSDPTLFSTHAVRDGDEWVITGEKWFTSAGSRADIIFVMCTNGMYVVPRDTPGVEIMEYPAVHNHIRYNGVRVPLDHLLGPEDGARVLAQRRLGGGRIHHAMRTVAQVKLAFDIMCERALSRQSHGKVIAEHQMVQEAIADSYAEINMLRLLVLWTAWTIDNTSTREARTQIAACKYTCAKVLREVSYRALHIMGSLGTTNLTPLQAMFAGSPVMAIADGVDEVHKVTVARNVLAEYEPHEGPWPTEYLPAKREQARKKYADLLASDPALAAWSERGAPPLTRSADCGYGRLSHARCSSVSGTSTPRAAEIVSHAVSGVMPSLTSTAPRPGTTVRCRPGSAPRRGRRPSAATRVGPPTPARVRARAPPGPRSGGGRTAARPGRRRSPRRTVRVRASRWW